ncbi:MAG: sulfite exporter TauE/SafE family protein [Paracoccaceae bacterium]|nr:sulfite exporter TauE/SafE family protein [Paracoccaceae bacterium]MDG1739552.1 sulfite exporter TauE/SafE family protein [Paracoccaceae bacterium]MDG2258196.1 sulfite exporter TauE/SafE family protein [Paracoccaceae bacterium]
MELPFDLASEQGIFLAAALVVAAFIRGLSGFGFSAVFILLAALVTNPLPLIPVVFACEIGMTVFQAKGIRPNIDWSRAKFLLFGSAVAILPSVAVMARLEVDQARLVISILIMTLSIVLLSGWSLKSDVGSKGTFAVGIAAGMANSAGVGGLVAAAFFTAQPIPAAVFRATMIVFLTGLDMMSLPVMGSHGLIGPDTFRAFFFAFPILGLGVWLGALGYKRITQTGFRRMVIIMLTVLSIINVAKVLL